MSMQRRPSLSVTYFDPEAEPVPEPEPIHEPPKPRGRPPGSKNKPKDISEPRRDIQWFLIIRALCWWMVAAISVTSLYYGVQGWLGQSAAYITLSVSIVAAAFLLDRDWKKMRG